MRIRDWLYRRWPELRWLGWKRLVGGCLYVLVLLGCFGWSIYALAVKPSDTVFGRRCHWVAEDNAQHCSLGWVQQWKHADEREDK